MTTVTIDGEDWQTIQPLVQTTLGMAPGVAGKALVIGGQALSVMTTPDHVDQFIELCTQCHVVVCARCAPVQKAEVVVDELPRRQDGGGA